MEVLISEKFIHLGKIRFFAGIVPSDTSQSTFSENSTRSYHVSQDASKKFNSSTQFLQRCCLEICKEKGKNIRSFSEKHLSQSVIFVTSQSFIDFGVNQHRCSSTSVVNRISHHSLQLSEPLSFSFDDLSALVFAAAAGATRTTAAGFAVHAGYEVVHGTHKMTHVFVHAPEDLFVQALSYTF